MKKLIVFVWIGLVVIGGLAGSADAYTAEVQYFFQGLDIDIGKVFTDPTMIMVLVGKPANQIEQLLKPAAGFSPDLDPATLVACLVHILVSYTLIVTFVARISPVSFLKKVMEPALVGLSTCSAAAAFPFSMRAQKQLGVSPKVFGFTLPMALTINMDGTALYQAVAATFVANAFGIDLTLTQQGTIVLTLSRYSSETSRSCVRLLWYVLFSLKSNFPISKQS